jgi:hypothetical protein
VTSRLAQSHLTTHLSREVGQGSQLLCLRAGGNSAFRRRKLGAVNRRCRHWTIGLDESLVETSQSNNFDGRIMSTNAFELTGEGAIRLIYLRTFSLAMTWRQASNLL